MQITFLVLLVLVCCHPSSGLQLSFQAAQWSPSESEAIILRIHEEQVSLIWTTA